MRASQEFLSNSVGSKNISLSSLFILIRAVLYTSIIFIIGISILYNLSEIEELPTIGMQIQYFVIGAILLLGGALLAILSIVNLAIYGNGTPAFFDPTDQVVINGCYNYIRNPIYLSEFLILCGFSSIFKSLLLLLSSFSVLMTYHLFVKYVEEPLLKKKFGPQYIEYTQRVKRWFFI